MNNENNAILASVKTINYRNGIDLLRSLDRTSALASLRSLAGAIQFTLVNTADYLVRQEQLNVPENPSLDLRNTQDEFARGITFSDGNSDVYQQDDGTQMDPKAKLKITSSLYWGLVNVIREYGPNEYERPKGLRSTLSTFVPRGIGLTNEQLALLEAAEMVPGELASIRDEATTQRAARMEERKPRIDELLEEQRCEGNVDDFLQLPIHIQLKLMTSAWKGVYYRRRQLVKYIASSGKLEQITEVKLMEHDLGAIEAWCREFERRNSPLIDVMLESGITVYSIEDAKADVKARLAAK